jgi:hypothetical protein
MGKTLDRESCEDEQKELSGPPRCKDVVGPIKEAFCILRENPRRYHFPEEEPEPEPEPVHWGRDDE